MSDIGATLNRLESIMELQNNNIENLSFAKSLITDSDIALEATKFAHAQILQQVGISLLTQTNNHNRGFVQRLLGI